MERTKLFVKGLSYSQTQTGAYALVLGEEKGDRRLPIIIGGFEAQSIAIALEKEVNPPRPLTHDLFKNFADSFDLNLKEVIIHKLKDGVFYSTLVCDGSGVEKMLDARTSDAVALAIRFKAPIYTYPEILEKAGVILKDGEGSGAKPTSSSRSSVSPKKAQSKDKPMSAKTLADLNKELERAVQNEDYETAARLRDEIDQRES